MISNAFITAYHHSIYDFLYGFLITGKIIEFHSLDEPFNIIDGFKDIL